VLIVKTEGEEELLRGRMGAATDEMVVEHVAAGEEGYASDSEAFASVHYVLDSVRMVRFFYYSLLFKF
jgi:hypothetical protein